MAEKFTSLGAASSAHDPSLQPPTEPFSTSSASTLNSLEEHRPHRDDPEGGVDVARAKEDFAELGRTLTRQSSIHRTQTRDSNTRDVEKDGQESEFDLLETMRGDKSARDAEGMKAKRVAVTWSDLKVVGGGGMKVSSQNFHFSSRARPFFR